MDKEYIKRKLYENDKVRNVNQFQDDDGIFMFEFAYYKSRIVVQMYFGEEYSFINLFTQLSKCAQSMPLLSRRINFAPIQFAVEYMEDKEKILSEIAAMKENDDPRRFTFDRDDEAWRYFEYAAPVLNRIAEEKKLSEIIKELGKIMKKGRKKI